MDDDQKKAALAAADSAVIDAEKELSHAQSELGKETDEKKKQPLQAAVDKAQVKVDEAKKAKADLAAGDVDDLVDTATRPPQLRDGSPGDKKIELPFDKFTDINEKAKLFEQVAPLLGKLKDKPEIIEQLLALGDAGSIADRVKALEQQQTEGKRTEIKTAIEDAVRAWPDFRSHWSQIQPIVVGLQAQGIAYREALQRAYFAVNPKAIEAKERLITEVQARDAQNRRGTLPPAGAGGGHTPRVENEPESSYELTDADREFASKMGIDLKLYAKHADFIGRFANI